MVADQLKAAIDADAESGQQDFPVIELTSFFNRSAA